MAVLDAGPPLHNSQGICYEFLSSLEFLPNLNRGYILESATHGSDSTVSAIDPLDICVLATKYGKPLRCRYFIETDETLRAYRWRQNPDRRGEVVFAIRQPNGEILLHTKHRYEIPIYRLPTGGIEPNEAIEDALFREISEETGQPVVLRRFLGIIEARFLCEGTSIPFVSYIFYLESQSRQLCPTDTEEIAGYCTVPVHELASVAQSLRRLTHERRYWGYWRSLAHDLVYKALTCAAPLQ